jgi:hypothetical protein
MSTTREAIFRQIAIEREKQDRLWGGADHDRVHKSHDWVAYITKHVGRAVFWPWTPEKFRQQMVIVAALAVAAVEWIDLTPPSANTTRTSPDPHEHD